MSMSDSEIQTIEVMFGMLCAQNANGDYCADLMDAIGQDTPEEEETCAYWGCAAPYGPDMLCQCNDLCLQYGDCCPDHQQQCVDSLSPTPEPTPWPTPGASAGCETVASDDAVYPTQEGVFYPDTPDGTPVYINNAKLQSGKAINEGQPGLWCPGVEAPPGVATGSEVSECSDTHKTQLEGLGCCWGTMLAMMALEEGADATAMTEGADACGVTLEATACDSDVPVAAVDSTVGLAGGTVETYCCSDCKKVVTEAVATTADVPKNSVIVTTCKASSRRAGVEVDSKIFLVGADASSDKVSAIETKLADTSALQSNLAAASSGTGSMGGVRVTSTAATIDPANSNGVSTASSSEGAAMMMIIIVAVVGLLLAVGVGVGSYLLCCTKSDPPTVTVAVPLEEKGDPPPGAVYMKNGQWLSADGIPVSPSPCNV